MTRADEVWRKIAQCDRPILLPMIGCYEGAKNFAFYSDAYKAKCVLYTFEDGSTITTTGRGPNQRYYVNGVEVKK